MTRSQGTETFTWIMAAICIILGVVIAPLNGGSTLVPVAIGIALGFMARDKGKKRGAGNASPMRP